MPRIVLKDIVLLLAFLLFTNPAAALLSASPAYVHDPFVIKEGEWYHLFASGQGVSQKRSRDMLKWESAAPVIPVIPGWTFEAVPGFTGRLWAPEVTFANGLFYMYYCVSTFGSNLSCIGLSINPTLDRANPSCEWKDEGKVIESLPGRDNWNAIQVG